MRRSLFILLACLTLSGCLLPRHGTPVLVDSLVGDHWSGEGRLLQVSEDRRRCRVAVRTRAGFVRKAWVPCSSVHPANLR